MADAPKPERAEKRHFERYDVSIGITFVCEITRTTYRGTIRNIGMGGVLLETAAKLTKMERITLQIPAGDRGNVKIGAVVVRYHRDQAVGVAFVAMSKDDRLRIEAIIARNRPSL